MQIAKADLQHSEGILLLIPFLLSNNQLYDSQYISSEVLWGFFKKIFICQRERDHDLS